jgi:hypothetical protein
MNMSVQGTGRLCIDSLLCRNTNADTPQQYYLHITSSSDKLSAQNVCRSSLSDFGCGLIHVTIFFVFSLVHRLLFKKSLNLKKSRF